MNVNSTLICKNILYISKSNVALCSTCACIYHYNTPIKIVVPMRMVGIDLVGRPCNVKSTDVILIQCNVTIASVHRS